MPLSSLILSALSFVCC